MIFDRQQIGFHFIALVLAVTLLLPSAVKFMHIFEKHHHEVCYGEASAHFHTLDIDCEFYKFQLNSAYIIPEQNFALLEYHLIKPIKKAEYGFLSEFQQLHFSLRGPPELI